MHFDIQTDGRGTLIHRADPEQEVHRLDPACRGSCWTLGEHGQGGQGFRGGPEVDELPSFLDSS